MPEDTMTFSFLPDGTVRITADKISGANHASADALVRGVEGLLAGKTDIARGVPHAHAHVSIAQKRDA